MDIDLSFALQISTLHSHFQDTKQAFEYFQDTKQALLYHSSKGDQHRYRPSQISLLCPRPRFLPRLQLEILSINV